MNNRSIALTLSCLALAACGGGSGTSSEPPPGGITDADRIAAATSTANNNAKCSDGAIGSFYWEIGDGNGVRASGQVGSGAPSAGTRMALFSSSKWVYAAYVAQKRGLRADDAPYLNFTSGHTLFGTPTCPFANDVQSCGASDGLDPDTVGHFYYDSGHMQYHARAVMGLGTADNAVLASEMRSTLGDFGFTYTQPQLAAGVEGTAQGYGAFLRRMLRGELALGAGIGTQAVPATYGNALSGPVAGAERWDYSLGQWVEADPQVGDRANSSAGGGGFYPWIDAGKSLYGILARERFAEADAGYHSAECGRLIRQAWRTGVAVTATTPTP
jgi:hypothetical protein